MGYIVVGPDGKEHGPVELETLVKWAQEGSLPVHAPVRDLTTGANTSAGQMAELRSLYPAQDFSQAPGPAVATASKGTALIPTGNPKALLSYYIGLASLIPCFGLFSAPVAIALGVKGLRAYNENPAAFGKGHAIAGIVLASIGLAGHLFVIVLVAINA